MAAARPAPERAGHRFGCSRKNGEVMIEIGSSAWRSGSRRQWLGLAGGAALTARIAGGAPERRVARGLGVYIPLRGDPDAALGLVRKAGSSVCEIYNDDFSGAMLRRLKEAASHHKVRIVALFAMGPGEQKWDFREGPATIGLVPRQFRRRRIDHLKRASDFAAQAGIPAVETHFGFVPEDPQCVLYGECVEAGREVARHCRSNGQSFLYHAGQETAVTLLRLIEDAGLDNQGVGLDTANPVMYGKGDPCDCAEILARHLRLVNLKDGALPADPWRLGRETPIGQGRVDFGRLFRQLKKQGYSGEFLIEREIAQEELLQDLLGAKPYLERLMLEAGL
jgi:sugar phosphate isomerase/epimerase